MLEHPSRCPSLHRCADGSESHVGEYVLAKGAEQREIRHLKYKSSQIRYLGWRDSNDVKTTSFASEYNRSRHFRKSRNDPFASSFDRRSMYRTSRRCLHSIADTWYLIPGFIGVIWITLLVRSPGNNEYATKCSNASIKECDNFVKIRLLKVTIKYRGPNNSRQSKQHKLYRYHDLICEYI